MKTTHIYVDRRGLRRRARRLLADAAIGLVVALAMLGHVLVLLLGAADALATSVLGVPRIAYGSRRFVEVVRETWKEEL
jgi:hypothetical protein